MRSSIRGLVLGALCLAAAGCGRESADLAPVHGLVTYKGTPLAGGCLVFAPNPDKGGAGPLARAEIGADGRYMLSTGDAAGAVPGWHRVAVLAAEPGETLPARYAAPDLSGLEGLVRAGTANVLDFRLE